jgi:hypothetical protein
MRLDQVELAIRTQEDGEPNRISLEFSYQASAISKILLVL